MGNLETKEIPFYDDTLLGVKDENGEIWLGVKKTCLSIGLTEDQGRRQIKNIQESLLFKSNCVKFDTVQNEGNRKVKRKVVCLREKFVPMWLAQISLTPKMKQENPEAVDKLLRYQLEATEVLHTAFYETEEQKATLHEFLGLEGRFTDVEGKLVEVTNQLTAQTEELHQVMDYMTINTTQQGKLQTHVKDRVRTLLGGAHSEMYKTNSRKYFSNLWGNFKDTFVCSSYKDLNPKRFEEALEFVDGWDYIEN